MQVIYPFNKYLLSTKSRPSIVLDTEHIAIKESLSLWSLYSSGERQTVQKQKYASRYCMAWIKNKHGKGDGKYQETVSKSYFIRLIRGFSNKGYESEPEGSEEASPMGI